MTSVGQLFDRGQTAVRRRSNTKYLASAQDSPAKDGKRCAGREKLGRRKVAVRYGIEEKKRKKIHDVSISILDRAFLIIKYN